METYINSAYLIAVGTLIGYERVTRCKQLPETEENDKFRQLSFCEGICCVQTYRNIEKALLEVKIPVYEKLLDKLGYVMDYDDNKYKEINYRLQNLNDAIEKYDLDSVFLIVEKLDEAIPKDTKEIYYIYIRRIVMIIYQYYKNNEFPSSVDVEFLKHVYMGFPDYIREVMIDILFKYGMHNIINDSDFRDFVKEIQVKNNTFIPNQINNLVFDCYTMNYDDFYSNFDSVRRILSMKGIYIRLIDIYDLKISADLNTAPTKIAEDIEKCEENVYNLFEKLNISQDNISDGVMPKMVKRKLSQHYYHLGYIQMMIKNYSEASKVLEKSLLFDELFEIPSKVLLFSCYDHLQRNKEDYKPYIITEKAFDENNKNFILYKYYQYKFNNSDNRQRLKYLKKYVLDFILPEDEILVRILSYEMNCLAKATSNYHILQEFIEKMGIIG